MTVLDSLVHARCMMPHSEAAITLSYYAEKPLSQHPGGIYRDQHDVLWLLKWLDPHRAVREVAACQLYRIITSSDAASETLLLIPEGCRTSGKWVVASRWVGDLKAFQHAAQGIEEAILASFLIGDKDATERNFAEYSDHVFRYDFEEALDIPEAEQATWLPLPNLYLILKAINFECFDIQINMKKMREVIDRITIPAIDWSFWVAQYKKALDILPGAQSVEAFSQQLGRIKKRLAYLRFESCETDNIKNVSYLDLRLYEVLLNYYRELMSYVKPLCQDAALQLAANHLKYWQAHGTHPLYYQTFKSDIEEKAGLLALYLNLRMKVNLQKTENRFYLAVAKQMKAIEAVEILFQEQMSTAIDMENLPKRIALTTEGRRDCSENINLPSNPVLKN